MTRQKGSHRQFKHSIIRGTVTVNGKPSDVLGQEILKQHFQTGRVEVIILHSIGNYEKNSGKY